MKHFSLNRLLTALPAVLLLGALSLILAPATQAQITLTFAYDGTDTVSTFNVATNSLAGSSVGALSSGAVHDLGLGGYWSLSGVDTDLYSSAGFTSAWDSIQQADSFSGDDFSLNSIDGFSVPTGYDLSTGSPLTGSMTWLNTSLTDLGFASNSVDSGSFAAAGTTVNWSTTSAVPEPSTYAAIFGGIALIGTIVRRRRSATSTNA